jgi:hypothetical protein
VVHCENSCAKPGHNNPFFFGVWVAKVPPVARRLCCGGVGVAIPPQNGTSKKVKLFSIMNYHVTQKKIGGFPNVHFLKMEHQKESQPVEIMNSAV